ncbi:MAG: hypothetical protein JO142_19560 [Burkholderiales bacterium]|nr:hypothetical protein [Burkholderiales bacterium]
MTLPNAAPVGLTMQLPHDRDVVELVDYIISQNRADLPHATKVHNIVREFGMTPIAAESALERVAGGMVLAAFGDGNTTPDCGSDPIAYHSFQRTVERRVAAPM